MDAEICTEKDDAPLVSEETVISSHSQGLVYNSFRVGSLFFPIYSCMVDVWSFRD